MASLGEAKHIQNGIDSKHNPSDEDSNLKEAIKQSNAIKEAFDNYLRFYAATIIKHKVQKKEEKLPERYLLPDEL